MINGLSEYQWPPVPGSAHRPEWTGQSFFVGTQETVILKYTVEESGWNDELTALHEQESGHDHVIDLSSRQYALNQLERYVPTASPVVLEVGCSSGYFLRAIREGMPQALLIGADYVDGPLRKIAQEMPEIPLLQFDLTKCPLPSDSVDAVVMLNVLEHIGDDIGALQQVHRILKPGGTVVIEVPAGPHLYDSYDKALMHYRRYSLKEIIAKVQAAGLTVLNASHLGFMIYPAFFLVKNLHRLKRGPESAEEIVRRDIRRTKGSTLLRLLMKTEMALGRRVSYPFGIRCELTCRKNKSA